MSTEQNVYLIGPMGVGKTTIGKSLARQLRLEFGKKRFAFEKKR